MSKRDIIILILVLFFAAAIRYLYFLYKPEIGVSADTYGYYKLGDEIMAQGKYGKIINDDRTPLYPLILGLSAVETGGSGAQIMSYGFLHSMRPVILFQYLLGLLSIVILFVILRRLLKVNIFITGLFTAFSAGNIMLFAWENLLLTETWSMLFLVFSLYLLLSLLHKWRISILLILLLTFCAGFLLKPVFIFLPFATLPILIFHFQNKKVYISSLTLLVFFAVLPVYYIYYNLNTYGYGGISHVSDINLLGKILQFNLPLKGVQPGNYFYKTVTDYRTLNLTPMPYRFLEHYDSAIYLTDKWKLNTLPSFNLSVIANNLPVFITDSLGQIPPALIDTSEIIKPDIPGGENTAGFFLSLYKFYGNMQYVFLIILIAYPLTVFLYLRKPDRKNTIIMLLGTIAAYQIIFSVFFSYGEFGRLISVAQPILYCFSFYWLWKLTFGSILSLFRKINR